MRRLLCQLCRTGLHARVVLKSVVLSSTGIRLQSSDTHSAWVYVCILYRVTNDFCQN